MSLDKCVVSADRAQPAMFLLHEMYSDPYLFKVGYNNL